MHDHCAGSSALIVLSCASWLDRSVQVRRIQNNVRGWILRKNYTNLREAAKVLQGAWREKKQHRSVPSQEISTALLRSADGTDGSPTSASSSSSPTGGAGGGGSGSGAAAAGAEKRWPGRRSYGIRPLSGGERSGPSESGASTPAGSDASGGGGGDGGTSSGTADKAGNRNRSFSADLQAPNPAQLMAAATLQAATRGMLARRSLAFSSVRKQTMASLVIQKSLVKWWESSRAGGGGSGVGSASSAGSTGGPTSQLWPAPLAVG